MSCHQNLEIMACSLKDLESAKEILSAKLFTQVINFCITFVYLLALQDVVPVCLFACLVWL